MTVKITASTYIAFCTFVVRTYAMTLSDSCNCVVKCQIKIIFLWVKDIIMFWCLIYQILNPFYMKLLDKAEMYSLQALHHPCQFEVIGFQSFLNRAILSVLTIDIAIFYWLHSYIMLVDAKAGHVRYWLRPFCSQHFCWDLFLGNKSLEVIYTIKCNFPS